MNLSKSAISNSRVVILLSLIIVIAGITLYLGYSKQEDPSITVREAVVTASFPGLSPGRVEDFITTKLEERIREISEVDTISSTSKTGVSLIHVSVRDEVDDLQPVWQNLRNRMDDVRSVLPSGTLGPFVNDEFGLTAIATLALWSDDFSYAEMRDTAKDIRDRLYAVENVKRIELFGLQEERIYLDIANSKLSRLGITPKTIADTLQAQNTVLSGGVLELAGRSFLIEPSGNYDDLAAIFETLITIPGSQQSMPLRDIAEIRREYVDPPDKAVFFNNKRAIIISISLLDSADAVAMGTELTEMVNLIKQDIPWGLELEYATYQPELIEIAVDGAIVNLGQTVMIVLAVVVLALGLRTGLIVGSFVPIVMLFGMVLMSFFDIELQRISIASMIIALGMLVDNGIVVAEDMRSRMQNGASASDAAINTGKTLTVPLLTSSLTTILAFMPLMLMVGAAGEYTGSLSYVIGLLMIGSWLLAMLVVPTIGKSFMRVDRTDSVNNAGRYDRGFYRAYKKVLLASLRFRYLVILLVVGLLVFSMWGFVKFVPKEFFPKGERSQYLLYVDMPSGTRSTELIKQFKSINDWLLDEGKNPEVTSTVAYAGQGGPRFFLSLSPIDPDPHRGFMLINVKSSNDVQPMVARTHNFLLENYPDIRGKVKAMWMGPTETGLYQVRISGTDLEQLIDHAHRVEEGLQQIDGIIDVSHDWENPVIKFKVHIDQGRARRAGVTSTDVANALNSFTGGTVVTDYREHDNVIPIIAQGAASERQLVESIQGLSIFLSGSEGAITLGQIADIEGVGQYSVIKRRNQIRTITIEAKHPVLKVGDIHTQMQPVLNELDQAMPTGYYYELGGEIEGSSDAQKKLMTWMPIAFALMFVLIVWQFNSIRRAIVIMLTIPLVMIGSSLGLIMMNAVFGFMTILGLLALAGIIINNGIVMIDRIEEERRKGTEPNLAIIDAAVTRFRPIFLSVMTTVLGLLPLIIYHDILFYGMASMMAFALVAGTALTLIVIPILYSILMNVEPRKIELFENKELGHVPAP